MIIAQHVNTTLPLQLVLLSIINYCDLFYIFRGKHEIVKSNIEVLVNIGLGERAKDDALLVRDTCTILLKLAKTEDKVKKYVCSQNSTK